MKYEERLKLLEEAKNTLKRKIKIKPTQAKQEIQKYLNSLEEREKLTLAKILQNPSSLMTSFLAIATLGVKFVNKYSKICFKFFLQVLNGITKFILKTIRMFMRSMTKSDIEYFGSFIILTLMFSIIGACIALAVGAWGVYTGRMLSNIKKKYGNMHDGIVDIEKKLQGDKLDIPDEFMPPRNFKIPDLNFTIQESVVASAGVYLFVTLLVKAIIVQQFNEDVRKRTHVIKGLFTPSNFFMSILVSSMVMGSKAALVL